MRIVFLDEENFDFRLMVEKRKGRESYRVTYGCDIRDNLTRDEAAERLGYSIFHALECQSKLDD